MDYTVIIKDDKTGEPLAGSAVTLEPQTKNTNNDGVAHFDTLFVTAKRTGYEDYVNQPYRTDKPVITLRKRTDQPQPEPLPSPTPPSPPTIPTAPPTIPQMGGDLVRRVKEELQRQGKDLNLAGAFQITNTVAWLLRRRGAGILDKPGGAHCEYPLGSGNFYATDIIIFQDGVYADILGDGGGANNPQWAWASDKLDYTRWRPPVNPVKNDISLTNLE